MKKHLLLFSLLILGQHAFAEDSAVINFSGFQRTYSGSTFNNNYHRNIGDLSAFSLSAAPDYYSSDSFQPISLSPNCGGAKDAASSGLAETQNWIARSQVISNQLSCLTVHTLGSPGADRYTSDSCSSVVTCANVLAPDAPTRSIIKNYNPANNFAVDDFVGVRLKENLSEMEKMEAVRKFSEKKFGTTVDSGSCKSPFDFDAQNADQKNNCSPSLVDSGFKQIPDHCETPFMDCARMSGVMDARKGYSNYLSSQAKNGTEDYSKSNFNLYFKDRIDNQVNDALANDNELLANLSDILTRKDSADVKFKNVYARLAELKSQKKLDPILSYENLSNIDPTNVSKHSFAALIEKLANTKSQNPQNVKDAIDRYRLDSSAFLMKKTCPSVMSYSKICKDATGLYLGTTSASQLKIDSKKLGAYIQTTESEDRLDAMRAFYPGANFSDQQLHALIEAARCKTYGIYTPIMDLSKPIQIDSPILGADIYGINRGYGNNNLNGFYNYNANPIYKFDTTTSLPDLSTLSPAVVTPGATDKTLTPVSGSNGAIASGASTAFSSKSEEITTVDSGLAGSLSAALNKTGSTFDVGASAPISNTGYSNVLGHSFLDGADATAANDAKKAAAASAAAGQPSAGNSALSDQLADLTRKLSATEDNLEKYKADKAAADSEKERQAKIDDQNNTIKDLRAQVDSLKSDQAQAQTGSTAAIVPASTAVVAANSALSLGKGTAADPKAADVQANSNNGFVQDANAARSVTSSGGAGDSFSGGSSSGSRGPASVGGASSAIGAVSSSSGAKSGIVLTKVDGLSSEKATETISDRITELNGQPFYIEEGGMVKEIIPIIKDGKVLVDDKGKPLFEKIVKGKVGDKKFANADARSDAAVRAPASITSPADLSRDQEDQMKRDRARYLKLKQITDGISGSN